MLTADACKHLPFSRGTLLCPAQFGAGGIDDDGAMSAPALRYARSSNAYMLVCLWLYVAVAVVAVVVVVACECIFSGHGSCDAGAHAFRHSLTQPAFRLLLVTKVHICPTSGYSTPSARIRLERALPLDMPLKTPQVYVRASNWDKVMELTTKDDIAPHLLERLEQEQLEKEGRQKMKQVRVYGGWWVQQRP